MPTNHHVVVLIGPSGSGKSSVVRELHARGLVSVRPTWTTRPRRADETDGSVEHRFVSDAEFDHLTAGRYFLDTVAMFGMPYRYGLPKQTCGNGVEVVMLRAPLVAKFRRFVPDFVVYQVEDSATRTAQRLTQRNYDPAEFAARVSDNAREIAAGRGVANRVFVNDRSIEALANDIGGALRLDAAVAA
jgi:guanylate kinase